MTTTKAVTIMISSVYARLIQVSWFKLFIPRHKEQGVYCSTYGLSALMLRIKWL